jgi:hypothetical protein
MGWNCPECGALLQPVNLPGWGFHGAFFGSYQVRPQRCRNCEAAYVTVFEPGAPESQAYVGLLKLDPQKAGTSGARP